MESKMKTCTNCTTLKHISNFISLLNGRECKRCLSCRECVNTSRVKKSTKSGKLLEHYNNIKSSLESCHICGKDSQHKELHHFDATGLIDVRNIKKQKL